MIEETPLLVDDVLIGNDLLDRYAVNDRFLNKDKPESKTYHIAGVRPGYT